MSLDCHFKEEELVFGLDIGTRTIMGILGFQKGKDFIVIAAEQIEHESRAMMDGQIHDIFKVAQTVQKVKTALEKRVGIQLKDVAIAAAGRVLKTYLVRIDQSLDEVKEIQKDLIRELELKGIDEAQAKLKEELGDTNIDYFCVGYSVVNYYLNEYIITNLEGHKGKKIGADVLATFLPRSVVESLYAVMDKVGLNVVSLTLEPIAAINVAIPENLRLLNLALVDVGAGTSDIAITKEGAVIGYGMIPIAGDEITERIVHKYLVDFQTAEKIKYQINKQEKISFLDILGIPHTVTSQELLEHLEDAVNYLADQITAKIYELNGNKAPNAVFCVGGGSQVKGLTEKISERLKLPKERVALRGGDTLINVKYECEPLVAPDVITPIGICVTSILQRGYDFIEVKVNGDPVKLLNTKRLTVADAGIQKGFNHTNLLGRKGSSLIFKLNQQSKKIWGEPAIPAELYVNGKEASLDTPIHAGDDITIKPAINGKPARAYIKDFLDEKKVKKIIINDIEMELSVLCMSNGTIVDQDTPIHNNDEIEFFEIQTIEDLARYADIEINGKEFFVNGEKVDLNYSIQNGDKVYFKPIKEDQEIIVNEENKDQLSVHFQDIPVIVTVNSNKVTLKGKKSDYIFVDIFNFIDFDLKNPQGNIVLKLNGKRAAFTDIIKQGDQIEIYWDKFNKADDI
ncbi:cell division protein FtsA [Defluviitalea saccharophila]|uniref:Cell division protein FtsA n=1 Tax=Defluviitalea saccharophila TaxID=879970 RepID=A0ABZ2Y4F0_9FIRM